MKNIHLSFLLSILLLSPSLCSAQVIETSLGFGYNIHSVPTYDHVNGNRGGLSAMFTGGLFIGDLWSGGILYEQNKWGYSTSKGNIDLALPARSYSAYICKHILLPNYHYKPLYSFFSVRVNAGFTHIGKGSPYVQPSATLGSDGYSDRYKGNGLNVGIQLEYDHPINKFFSGFGNIGTSRAFISGKNTRTFVNPAIDPFVDNIKYNLQYYTAAVGIIYRFQYIKGVMRAINIEPDDFAQQVMRKK